MKCYRHAIHRSKLFWIFAVVAWLTTSEQALAQSQPVLSLNNGIANNLTYDSMSFGRGNVTFKFFVTAANATSFDTTITATLPRGLSFVSTNNGTATVLGTPAVGEQVMVNLGQLFGAIFNYAFTAAIDHSQPDGTQLPVTFQLSGHANGSATLQVSNLITFTVQAGYVPVGVLLSVYDGSCSGAVGSAATGFTRFNPVNLTSSDGSAIGQGVQDSSGASAVAGTDHLSDQIPLGGATVKVGEIDGPGSTVTLRGIGYRASAQGGVSYVVDVSDGIIEGFPTTGSAFCEQTANVGFSNPNPYPIALIVDQRFYGFSAAGNEAAKDPISGVKFGFPGHADFGTGGSFNGQSGSGVATNTVFSRLLYAPSGNTLRTKQGISCFAEAQSTCDSNPPSDATSSIGGAGGWQVPAIGENDAFDLNPLGNESVEAFGGTNISYDANTGSVSVVRSGYGTASAKAVTVLLRGDADLGNTESALPAKLEISGNSPGINLLVTDGAGHRTGFQAANTSPLSIQVPPGAPSPQLDAQPTILAEIFGASYSGIQSQPQVIGIPDPQPGSYRVDVTATADPSFTLTAQTLDINDNVIDTQSTSGTVATGGSASSNFVVDEHGHINIPGAVGSDTIPSVTIASVSPQPNAAGWNNSNVTVTLNSTDNPGGSGVKQITYSSTGAQGIASTSISGNSAIVGITNEGQTTISFFASDNAGNVETAKLATIMLDKTAPAINCGASDGQWHAADVSIPCNAIDNLSGLANSSDGSFSLSTTVPIGSETANGLTGTRSVCDVAGNCANAGPVGGNMIDKKPPTITISSPISGTYLLNQTVVASYSCNDGGSGVALCSGTVATGANVNTASIGSTTFTVDSTDRVGNEASPQSVNYIVAYGVCILYDPTRSVQSGSTIPLKMQLCDANQKDVSGSSVVVHAVSLEQASSNASETIQTSGNANPDNDFRFDSSLGSTGGYIFNLSTKGLATGSYILSLVAGVDPTAHTLTFQVR